MHRKQREQRGTYRPQGFCPHCGYPMDAGQCPECGRDVSEAQLDGRRFGSRRRGRLKRVLVALSVVGLLLLLWFFYEGSVPQIWGVAPTALVLSAFGQGSSTAAEELVARFERGSLTEAQAKTFFEQALSVQANVIPKGGDGNTDSACLEVTLVLRIPGVMSPRWSVHLVDWEVSSADEVVDKGVGRDVHVANLGTIRVLQWPLERLSEKDTIKVKLGLELRRPSPRLNSGSPPLHVWNIDVETPVP